MATIESKIDKLSAHNYSVWQTVITSHLKGKDLWDYVNESKNDTAEAKIGNEKAKSLIYCSMEPQQIAATGVCDTAHALWTKIKENHQGSSSKLKSIILAEFLGMKYAKNESIINFAGRYETVLGRLLATELSVDEKTKLWVFSNSLPQHMQLTVQMFEMANPDGKVGDLISQLKIRHHMDTNDTDRKGAAYHTLEKPQYNNNSKPQQNRSSNITCNYCKKQGHVWKECRKLKYDNERKKKFGQMKQQKPQPNRQSSKQNDKATTSAFNARVHEFSEGKHSWIVDSGASCHISPYQTFLVDYEKFDNPRKIYLGDGKTVEAYGKGRMPFTTGEFTGELRDVLWVPEMSENLFSLCKAMEMYCDVQFCKENSEVLFYRNNKLVLRGRKKPTSTYFLLSLQPLLKESEADESALIGATLEEWHKRLGHCSMDAVKALIQSNAVEGMRISSSERHECRACIMGKLCRSHHPNRQLIKATEDSAILHIDTVGPMKKMSVGGSRYFVLATEEYSNYKLFETMGSKASIPDAVKSLINQAELESGRPVKGILTDNGTEFTNENLKRWIENKGIVHNFSATYTPEQNGRAERANRTVLDGIRTLLNDSGLPEELWAEALNTVVYTTNRILDRKNQGKTRFELFTGRKPDISNLRIFGQKAIIRESNNARDGKLAPRGEEATFVGYTERHNTYRFYLTEPVQQIIVSCYSKFINQSEVRKELDREQYVVHLEHNYSLGEARSRDEDTSSETTEQYDTSPENNDTDSDETVVEASQPLEPRVTRSKTAQSQNDGPALVGVREGVHFTLDNEPRTVKDAQESEDWARWQQAMDEEIQALEKNKTWILVDKPSNVKPIKNKWVYKAKITPDGSIERFKARLVAKGFTQIPNVDYKETYAPVASMTTIRMFLAIANQNSMHIVQFDVKTAFLYGDLEEELYMEQPENYKKDPNKVCKLVKSLYGLKQAPRQWNKKFDSFLKIFELTQSSVDKCLYFNKDKSLLLAIYVDDGLAAGRSRKLLDKLITHLKDNFELKVMEARSYLGFEITRDLEEKTLSISQTQYVDKILNRFGMIDCKPVSTPEEMGVKFNDSPLLPTENQFKELVGSLLYLTTCSRPDIAHAVSIASRTSQPTQAHWVALKRILRYLKGTRDLGVRFRWENPNKLIGYSDADYANDEETRKSTTGLCIFLGGGPIAWRCQRQPIITLSTTEAEYVAGCELVKEILPIRQQLIELDQIAEQEPTKIFIDNQSAVKIASNEGGMNRTKHIDIREKWLTEQVMNKKIEVEHISGDEQTADMLTKPLYKSKFIANRSKLLTQILMATTIMALCSQLTESRNLKLTDPATTVASEKIFIKGDTRYRSTIIFMNPCDHLFNYSTTVSGTEYLVKYCYEYFERKHFGPLTNCKRLPTIGPDLKQIPLTYNCVDDPKSGIANGEPFTGKCDISRRNSKDSLLPVFELDSIQESWNKHKKLVQRIPSLQRSKRIIPAIIVGFALSLGIIAGPAIKTYKITQSNADNIEQLANVTDLHSRIIKESTQFFDQYRDSVATLHTWAQDVEERLGDDPLASRLNTDPVYRGKKANLVKSYMQWFDAQEKLLLSINDAAAQKKISTNLKTMLNGTSSFDKTANLSTLFECSYKLENKSMYLDLEFLLPTVDENIEVLKVLPTDIYTYTNHSDERGEEYCWEVYTGSSYVMHNKTNGCLKPLNKIRNDQIAIRDKLCLEPVNELYYPTNRDDYWLQESCFKDVPKIAERIQIMEIDGAFKIYCYPFSIEIDNEEMPCPNSTFILEGHANYRIGNLTHEGTFVDTSNTRQIQSTRNKRSPLPPPNLTTAPKQASVEVMTAEPKFKISDAMRNLTGQMNSTIVRIKESIKLLPTKLNITRENFDSLLDMPFELLTQGVDQVVGLIRSLGSTVGLLSVILFFVMIMPAIELMIIGLKIAKIPANMWLSSARRVSTSLKDVSDNISMQGLTSPFLSRRRRWTDTIKSN